jgi:hypothetical protein
LPGSIGKHRAIIAMLEFLSVSDGRRGPPTDERLARRTPGGTLGG